MVHSCICLYTIFIFVELSSFYYHDFVYYYWCHLSSGYCWKSCLESCLHKLQNAVIALPGYKGMQDKITLFEMLSVVFVIVTLIVFELLQPGDQVGSNTWITFKCVCQSQSWTGQQVSDKKNKPCAIIKRNALPLMSLCFVTFGCWKSWWQWSFYDYSDRKYQHGNCTKQDTYIDRIRKQTHLSTILYKRVVEQTRNDIIDEWM